MNRLKKPVKVHWKKEVEVEKNFCLKILQKFYNYDFLNQKNFNYEINVLMFKFFICLIAIMILWKKLSGLSKV